MNPKEVKLVLCEDQNKYIKETLVKQFHLLHERSPQMEDRELAAVSSVMLEIAQYLLNQN